MDKFAHEKHNRRERVYKFPRINLWKDSSEIASALRKQGENQALEYKCLELYRDFFRNPKNHEYLQEPLKSRKFLKFSEEFLEQLKFGSKVFGRIEIGSTKYKEFMTPRELLFWDESNKIMYENYRAAIKSLEEINRIESNENMLNRLRRTRFESD